jgi:hypothetical protein
MIEKEDGEMVGYGKCLDIPAGTAIPMMWSSLSMQRALIRIV